MLETRPEKGLLGGMLGWPGTEWSVDAPAEFPPFETSWREFGEVRHTFTHFHLRLKVVGADVPLNTKPKRGNFVEKHDFRPNDLPTVMKKAISVATPWPEAD